MARFDEWNGGSDQGEDGRPTPKINGGLLDPRTFPSPWPPAEDRPQITPQASILDDDWLERPLPLFKRPLDADTHAEVLQDIKKAQAKLPPISSPKDDVLAVFGRGYSILQAEGLHPAQLNGVTSIPSADMVAAGLAGAPTVAVTDGGPEKLTYMIPFPVAPTAADVDPSTGLARTFRTKPLVFMPSAGGATPGSGQGYDTAAMPLPPPNALAMDHGHRDGISDGFVDAPSTKFPYGDTQSLSFENPIPTATVSDGRVGWHVLDKGRLKFIFPSGSMTPEQVEKMQRNLNDEQKKFLRPK